MTYTWYGLDHAKRIRGQASLVCDHINWDCIKRRGYKFFMTLKKIGHILRFRYRRLFQLMNTATRCWMTEFSTKSWKIVVRRVLIAAQWYFCMIAHVLRTSYCLTKISKKKLRFRPELAHWSWATEIDFGEPTSTTCFGSEKWLFFNFFFTKS